MLSAADIAREQEAGLALLFERGLELALKLQDDAMAAESPEARVRLAGAFHRISRSVRQTAALRAKLAADAERAGREAQVRAAKLEQERLEHRKAQVRATLDRIIWTEAETQEREDELTATLELFLDEDEHDGEFALTDPATHIARLCNQLGLNPPPPEDPPPQGEVALQATEGASAVESPKAPNGPRAPDHPWQSSA